MEEQRHCPNCDIELKPHVKFCTNCGFMVSLSNSGQNKDKQESESIQIRFENILSDPNSLSLIIIILAIFGVYLIGVTLIDILELATVEIPYYTISIMGWIVYGILLISIILPAISNKLNSTTKLILLILAEVMLLTSQYSVDVLDRSSLTRHSLLISGMTIGIIGTLLTLKLPKTVFGDIHQIFISYAYWIIIYFVRGSNYVNIWIYTGVILVAITLFHAISLYTINATTMAGFMIFEFLILLQTEVINSSIFEIISVLMILQLPILFKLNENRLMKMNNTGWRIVIGLQFLPVLALVSAIGRGALRTPYPHILFSLLMVSWIVFLYYIQQKDEYDTIIFNQISLLLAISLVVGGFFYTINSTNIDMVSLIIGIIIGTSILASIQKNQFKLIINFALILLNSFAVYRILDTQSFGIVVTFLMSLLLASISLLIPLIRGDLTNWDLIIPQFTFAGYLLDLYLVDNFSPFYFGAYIILQLIFYFWQYQLSFELRYPILAMIHFIPGLTFVRYIDENINYAILLLVTQFVLLSLIIIDRSVLKNDLGVVSWLLIFLPFIFGWVGIQNNYVINSVVVLLSISAVLTTQIQEKNIIQQFSPLLFTSIAIVLRIIQFGNGGQFLGFNAWSLAIITILVFNALYYIVLFTLSTTPNYQYYIFYILGWKITATFAMIRISNENMLDEQYFVYYIIQVVLVLFFVTTIFNQVKVNKPDLDIAITSIFIAGLFFLINLYDPTPELNWIAWIIFVAFITFYSLYFDVIDNKIANYSWMIVYMLNLVTLITINSWTTSAAILLFTIILHFDKHFTYYSGSDKVKEIWFLLFAHLFLLSITTIFQFIELISILQGIVVWFLITIPIAYTLIQSKGQTIASAQILILLHSLFILIWMIQPEFHIVIIATGIINSTIFFSIRSGTLLSPVEHRYVPSFNLETLSIAISLMAWSLAISWTLVEMTLIRLIQLNQVMIGIMSIVLLTTLFVEKWRHQSMLSSGVIIYSFLTLLTSTLIGFFETPVANIVIGVISISLSIIALILKDTRMLAVSLGVALISVFKGVIDFLILTGVDQSLSLLIVGVQIVWYTIILSNTTLFQKEIK